MKNAVFWDMAPCRSCVNRRFGGTYRPYFQGRKIRERGSRCCNHQLTLVPRSRIFLLWWWRRYVPPKRRFIQDLHGATSQKTAFFIVTAAKTWNLTLFFNVFSRPSPPPTTLRYLLERIRSLFSLIENLEQITQWMCRNYCSVCVSPFFSMDETFNPCLEISWLLCT
jgi:hypothetical protein